MSLGKSYAKALYEAAKGQGASGAQLDQTEQQLDDFASLLQQNPDLNKALLGPIISLKEKAAVVDAIAQKSGYTPILKNFLSLLISKERLPAVIEINEAFTSVRLEAEGGVSGRLVSADAVSDNDVKELAEAFSRKLGKRVAFRVSTDASLLAGMKVTVNGVTYDGTLKSQLQRLRDNVVTGYAQ